MKSTAIISTSNIPLSCIPNDGLRFFHGLSNWVEQAKKSRPSLIHWKQGDKALTILKCVKSKDLVSIVLPHKLPCNTLYVPKSSSGWHVLCQLRHAFCHNALEYNEKNGQYYIKLSDKVKIAGQFSLEAIAEFVSVFLSESK